MGRPEQHGKGKRSPAHKGKHGGEIVGDRHEGGAFAKGNKAGHGSRTSAGMRMRNKLREVIGEEGIEDIAKEFLQIVRNEQLDENGKTVRASYDTKERISAGKAILEFVIGKPQNEVVVASETDGNGAQRIVFAMRGKDDIEDTEL